MSSPATSEEQLRMENAELGVRLEEAEETLRAIRMGEVDSLVVETPDGPQIFSLNTAEAASNRLRGDILAQVSDAVGMIDNDERIIFLNPACERLYRVQAGRMLGRKVSELYQRRWLKPEDETVAKATLWERGEALWELIHVTHDGRELHVQSSVCLMRDSMGNTTGIIATMRDVTERKAAEENLRVSEASLRLSEERLNRLHHIISDPQFGDAERLQRLLRLGVEEFGLENGVIAKISDGLYRVALADTPDDSVPAGFTCDLSDTFCAETLWQNDLLAIQNVAQSNMRTLRAHTEFGIESYFGVPLPVGGEIFGTLSYSSRKPRDRSFSTGDQEFLRLLAQTIGTEMMRQEIISKLSAAEERQRHAMQEAQRSARAKDDFLAALSHELRTPLTPVLMTASALEGDPALPMEVREQFSMMRRNIELEARLIDDLLDLTRISRGKLNLATVVTDLHVLLGQTDEIIRSDGLGKQVQIVLRLGAQRHHALLDPTRIQQVFWNLIKNAVKFTPSGGNISVSTTNDVAGRIVISVKDNGIGISAEILPRIFNAFEQGTLAGQHRYGGLGLGLAISQAIITAHEGDIRGESPGLDCGSTFTVVLPTIDALTDATSATESPGVPERTLKLLIVEDHEATRQVLNRLLTLKGHQVITAGSLQEALMIHKKERFDAVISDIGLPDGSGLDLMRALQQQRLVPGIALSGYGMEGDLHQTREAGFFAHLVKPVNFDQLRQLIDQIPTSLP